MNLVTFLGNEKGSGYIKRSISEWSPVQAGLSSLGEPAGVTAATQVIKKDKEAGNKVSGHGTMRHQRHRTVNMTGYVNICMCNHVVN